MNKLIDLLEKTYNDKSNPITNYKSVTQEQKTPRYVIMAVDNRLGDSPFNVDGFTVNQGNIAIIAISEGSEPTQSLRESLFYAEGRTTSTPERILYSKEAFDLMSLNETMGNVYKEVVDIKIKVAELTVETKNIKERIEGLTTLQTDVETMKNDLKSIKDWVRPLVIGVMLALLAYFIPKFIK